MGCFLSLLCGIRESESRSQSRRRERLNSVIDAVEASDLNEEVLVYSSETGDIRGLEATEDKHRLGIPLKRIKFKWRLESNISADDLKERRKSFWETCYTIGGQAQVWDALKIICENSFEDLELACSILDSCEVILPYGNLIEIYDSKGFRYNLPPYCVCDPITSKDGKIEKIDSNISVEQMSQTIKIRLSDGTDVELDVKNATQISDIKAQIRDKKNIDISRRMVVLWCGRVLEDELNYRSLSLPPGAVLQVMVPQ